MKSAIKRAQTTRRAFLGRVVKAGLGSALAFVIPSAISAAQKGLQSLTNLAKKIKGSVVPKSHPNYEVWRRSMTWQMYQPARYPELIVQPNSVAEVVEAIRYARRTGLKVAVRSGGGNHWSNFLRNGGMLIDMFKFRAIAVDPGHGTAQAGVSVNGYELTNELSRYGYAFPVAHSPLVNLGGFLLGGGVGINNDHWGISCFSVLGAEVVMADGDVLTVTPERHPDIFWALQGGGNGFPGVVTRFNLKLYSYPRFVATSSYVFPWTCVADVGDWLYRATENELPKTELKMNIRRNWTNAGEAPTGNCSVRAHVFADSETEARGILSRLSGDPMTSEAIQKSEFQPSSLEALFVGSPGKHRDIGFGRWAVDSIWSDTPKEALLSVRDIYLDAPSWNSNIGASFSTRRYELPDAAFSVKARAYMGFGALWYDSTEDTENFAWLRRVSAALRPFAAGYNINQVDMHSDPHKIRHSFSPAAWEKLRTVRGTHDPDGIFHDFFGLSGEV